MKRLSCCAAAALILTVSGALAEAMSMPKPMNAADLPWTDAPPIFARGAKISIVAGDPSKEGLYVVRMRMPPNYRIAAHHHPTAEYVTVLSGSFHIGMGDKLDMNKGVALEAGGFAEAPAKMNHYAWTTTETVVQVHGEGPFALTYVDPADDPTKQ